MKFGIRMECGLDNYEERLDAVKGVPIELALPYKLDEFLTQNADGLLERLTAYIKKNGTIIQSVHAPQGHLTDGGFHRWGLETVRFAEQVGAGVVVFHPEDAPKTRRADVQITALQNTKRLQRETSVVVAVETFGGNKRCLFPEELIEKNIPMVLDVSHLFPDRTMDVISKYHSGIVAVHLSEARDGCQHMPVEAFGFKVMDALKAKGWQGTVTLEYLPDYHHRMIPDREMLANRYAGNDYGLLNGRAV